ncbi:conserved Plasmodium protein, unknown function [Plasmodium vinckei lentum]|uniref:Swt1-like HEPN domain-containing protein n=1 Tax=Plasmodium vinckei lentum TaxID=138297 RepID=A0A6V7SD39_PLAVN|nr:conserved Plasmodium protein, unknown function [Plasmodium vinckei lentum]
METRECDIRIINGTSCAFYRYMHSVKHGVWLINPPECINSKGEGKCVARFTKTMGNFYGILQYCVVINNEEYILDSRFDIPLLGDNTASAVLGMNLKNETKQILSHQKYFIVKHSHDNTYNSKFYINILETEEGRKFIEYHKKRLKKGLIRILNIRSIEEKEKIRKANMENAIRKNENNGSNNINNNTNNNNDNTGVSVEDKLLYSTYRNEEIMEILPLSFIINVKNYDWERRLRKSHKSLYILIINFTRQTLILPDVKKGKSSVLTDGNWVEFPSEKIASLRCSEFGCNNDGMFSSINGYCKYKFMNESCYLNIFWDINNVNSNIKCNIKNTTKYTIIKNVEIYNECTAVFHILEYYYYPPIKLLECRALTNNIINNYGINKNNIDENMNIIYQCSISVIRQFCQYLHNNAQQENNTNDDSLNMSSLKTLMNDDYSDNLRNKNIFSPDFSKSNKIISVYSNELDDDNNVPNKQTDFDKNKINNDNSYLNDLNDKKSVTLDNDTIDYSNNEDFRRNIHDHNLHLLRKKRNVNSNSLCYINRKNIFTNINITAARDFFCYMHGNNYSNNIPINSYLYISWNIGNIIYRNLYKSSENIIINAHSLLSNHNINDDVILKLKIDENNRRIYPSYLIQNLLMNVKSDVYINNEYVVLDIILNIFHILSAHLSPIIEQIMEMEYGDRWLIDSKIPKSNIWEKSKGKNELDIEGIIHILTTFWMDIFENRIKNIMILENLQKASIFWANQEIDQFDQEFVKKLIESSSLLLKIFGDYNTAKSIEKFYYNKYSIFNDICVD